MKGKFDFSGWATRNDLKCSDGRTIRANAFSQNDGKTVPLCWMHDHDDPAKVLGHAVLENRKEGVYAYCEFNDSAAAETAKHAVQHGDVTSLSIWANHLQQTPSRDVLHGDIKEVSLVLAGANPGAFIDNPIIEHSDGLLGEREDVAQVFLDDSDILLYHSDEDDDYEDEDEEYEDEDEFEEDDDDLEHSDNEMMSPKTIKGIISSMTPLQQKAVAGAIATIVARYEDEDDEEDEDEDDEDDEDLKHSDDNDDEMMSPKTIKEIISSMTPLQQKAVGNAIATIIAQYEDEDDEEDEDDVEHSEFKGGNEMRHNVFEQDTRDDDGMILSHDDMMDLMSTALTDAKRGFSVRDTIMAHADADYGIKNIEILFPDAKTITDSPDFIKRETEWVATVLNGTHHTPFSRIKSTFANITADEARARGYVKGKKKVDEVITLLKRTTNPQTIYKKQKLDRDDIIDITDFDVLAWLKGEMRIMLDEEIAGAILVGDGRNASDDSKIQELNIRPIVSDDDLYAYKIKVDKIVDETTAKAAIKSIIRGYKNYRGSGNKTMFVKQSVLCEMLLVEDGIGHMLYESSAQLATKLRVNKIVEVPDEIFERNKTIDPQFIIVDLNDYNVGADKGGAVNMFDDFDIDFNQMKYLIETRCSGALIKPFSAMVGSTTTASAFDAKSPVVLDADGKKPASNPESHAEG